MLEKRDYVGMYGSESVHNYYCSSCDTVKSIVDVLAKDAEFCPACLKNMERAGLIKAKKTQTGKAKVKAKSKPKTKVKASKNNNKKPATKVKPKK